MDRTPEHLMDQFVSIHRPVVALDDSGAAVTTWPTWRESVAARLCPQRGSVGEHFGRAGTLRRWRIYMAGGNEVRPGDRLQWRGHVMDVQSAVDAHAQGKLLVIEAQEIQAS